MPVQVKLLEKELKINMDNMIKTPKEYSILKNR